MRRDAVRFSAKAGGSGKSTESKVLSERPRGQGATSLPQELKVRVESMSGVDLSGVKVYRNSRKPSALEALAYTQGENIFLGPDQERYLAHEAWHAVQQKKNRVRPTKKYRGLSVNDCPRLEQEADLMGARATRKGEG